MNVSPVDKYSLNGLPAKWWFPFLLLSGAGFALYFQVIFFVFTYMDDTILINEKLSLRITSGNAKQTASKLVIGLVKRSCKCMA